MDLNPREQLALSQLGYTLYMRGHPARAERIFRGLTALSSQDGYAWRMLGACRRCLDDAHGSASAFERALEIDPDDTESRVAYAELLVDHRRAQDARSLLEAVVHDGYADADPHLTRRARAIWRRCQQM